MINAETFILPVLLGLVGGILSAFVAWVVERAKMIRSNREMQLQMSIDLCKKVIDTLDSLYAHMHNDAWHVAWRKATSDKYNYPDKLVAQDAKRWENYTKCLNQWRSNVIGYETELKGSFGHTGYESFLFLDANNIVEQSADMAWKIYYCVSEDSTIPTFKWIAGKPVIDKQLLDTTEAGQLQNMEEYFTLMDKLRDRISTLSSTMIYCIQVQNVGNLSGGEVPIPEEAREEAEALLGVRRFESKGESTKLETGKRAAGNDSV
jgi:hypothetical protein